jgi:cation transport ATPase
MTTVQNDTSADAVTSVAEETRRIMSTGSLWMAAVVVAPGLTLGPLLAQGWRPADLPGPAAIAFWLGALVAAVGTGLLMWAGCPVLAYSLDRAYAQKVFSIRVGVVLAICGLALGGLALLLSPTV